MEYNSINKDSGSNYYTPYTPQENYSNQRFSLHIPFSYYKIYEDLTKIQTNCRSNQFRFCFNKKIYKLDSNTFFYSEFYFFRYIVLYFTICALCTPLIFYDPKKLDLLIVILPPSILLIIIIVSCVIFLDTYIIFDSNTIKVMKKAICRKKGQNYFLGEIEKIDLGEVVYNDNNEIESKSIIFYLFKTTGEKQLLFKYNKFDNNNRTKVDMDSLNEFLKEINSLIRK